MTHDIDADDSASMIGRRLGRYTCVRRLGSGGMADVYLARRSGAKGFSKVFALKRVKAKYARDPEFTRMFLREAKLSSSLDHPNIAQVVDFGQDGFDSFLVMEYVHGVDLRQCLRSSEGGRLPLPCSIAVITRVCAALHYAHERARPDGTPLELVHRDVSPNNVLLSLDGAVKLTDFGIAKGFGQGATGTASSMLVGKPGYMSPEQVRCEPLDRRSDVFAIGILLYEATTGHRCFYGDSVFATLNATQRASFVPPRTHVADYPEALAQIVGRALDVDPQQRFASARQLQSALEEFALDQRLRASDAVLSDYLGGLGLTLHDPSLEGEPRRPTHDEVQETGGTALMLSDPSTVVAPPPAPAPARSPRRWWLGGAVLLTVGGLGALGVTATRESTPPPEPDAAPLAVEEHPSAPAPSEPETLDATAPSVGAPTSETPAEPEAGPVEGEPQPTSTARPRRSNKRRKRRPTPKDEPESKDLDILAPPSRRRE